MFGIDEIALGLEIIVAARNVRNFISNNSVATVFEVFPILPVKYGKAGLAQQEFNRVKTGTRKQSEREKQKTNRNGSNFVFVFQVQNANIKNQNDNVKCKNILGIKIILTLAHFEL